VDLALLRYPLQFGSVEWEFGTISAHLNGMPLGTMGLILLAAGTLGSGWRCMARGLAVFCAVVAVGVVSLSVIYLLDVPVALKGAPQVKSLLIRAIVKAGMFAITYTTLYAWLARFLWRHTQPSIQASA
jgi:hypothetical protein